MSATKTSSPFGNSPLPSASSSAALLRPIRQRTQGTARIPAGNLVCARQSEYRPLDLGSSNSTQRFLCRKSAFSLRLPRQSKRRAPAEEHSDSARTRGLQIVDFRRLVASHRSCSSRLAASQPCEARYVGWPARLSSVSCRSGLVSPPTRWRNRSLDRRRTLPPGSPRIGLDSYERRFGVSLVSESTVAETHGQTVSNPQESLACPGARQATTTPVVTCFVR